MASVTTGSRPPRSRNIGAIASSAQTRADDQPAQEEQHVLGHDHGKKIGLRVTQRAQQRELSATLEHVRSRTAPSPSVPSTNPSPPSI